METVNPTSTPKTWTLHIDSFTDVPATSPYYRFVETLFHRNITAGCGGGNYCPAGSTKREQMAKFVLVAKEGPSYTPPVCSGPTRQFSDVPAASESCPWIEELFRRGITSGYSVSPPLYCPNDPVTREQMSVFLTRTFSLLLYGP